MAQGDQATRELLASVVAPLVERHGGSAAVGRLVNKHRTTVHRWTKGDIQLPEMGALACATGEDIVLTFPGDCDSDAVPTGHTKTPPPDWAGAMEDRIVSEVQANREALYARLADDAATKALRLAGLLPDAQSDETQDQPPGSAGPLQGPTT